jgi:hypothetical protein
MPGKVTAFYDVENKPEHKPIVLDIINGKKQLFIAEVKGYIDRKYLDKFINFLPIFRNIEIKNDKETIGEYMFDYMVKNKMKTGNIERKLTQLADTNNEFMSFSSYYLWYLIDKFHFIITDIKSLIVFSKQDEFGSFVNEFSFQRWKNMVNKSAKENFFKISLNGSYGHDGMNTENYSKSFIQNEARANTSKLSDQFKNIRQLVDKEKDQTYDSIYQVDMDSDKFKCQTPLQQAYFTLDNAKYWFLVFIYEFMYNCMDMNKIHFIYGDTDSMYFAIAGDPNEDYNQGFKHVVLDKEYYDEHVFKSLPFDTFCFQESSRPT